MLTDRYTREFLYEHLLPLGEWHPFPRACEREAWERLKAQPGNEARIDGVAGVASESLTKPWPVLTASRFMDYVRDGNRDRYQKSYFERRHRVGFSALAECLEHQGRFVDDVIDGLWLICDEATWCVPAHIRPQWDGALPRLEHPVVDLFAAETALVLAESYWLCASEVDGVSHEVGRRLHDEVLRRVIEPCETRDDWGWFSGFNNWTPWVCSSVLGTAMYTLNDNGRLADLVHRLLGPLERFIARYGDDGGCDEGPGYWNHAAGSLLTCLELLHSRTGGAVDVFAEPKLRAMGRYIHSMHLHGPWFVNFADASARSSLRRAVLYRYGERTGDEALKTMALLHRQGWDPAAEPRYGGDPGKRGKRPASDLLELFWMPPGRADRPLAHAPLVWLPNLQVALMRESTDSSKGLVLAAKGGTNGESHNHNDIGQFVVMLDGEPRIIDIGVEGYTSKTFGPHRYDIWCIRGSAHNAPVVNGIEQAAGEQYHATNVAFAEDGAKRTLSMNLHTAYPENAGLASLRRAMTLDLSGVPQIRISDTFAMRDAAGTLTLTLFSPSEMRVAVAGEMRIAGGKRDLVCRYPSSVLTASVDTVPLDDRQLSNCWGEKLWRCTFTLSKPVSAGEYELQFGA